MQVSGADQAEFSQAEEVVLNDFLCRTAGGVRHPEPSAFDSPVDDREFVLEYLVTGGDVPRTYASSGLLNALTGFTPSDDVEEGVKAFVDWYRAEIMQSGLRAG